MDWVVGGTEYSLVRLWDQGDTAYVNQFLKTEWSFKGALDASHDLCPLFVADSVSVE